MKGVVLWVDDFSEVKHSSLETFKAYANLIKSIKEKGKDVHVLYGGYFSYALHKLGVTSISHGVGYGESKPTTISPSKGGPPLVRYYIKDLKCFFTLDRALVILRKFPELICNCHSCRRVMQGDPENIIKFENEEALSNFHFLECRFNEKKYVSNKSLNEIVLEMEKVSEKYQSIEDLGADISMGYMRIWIDALKPHLKK